MPKYYTLSGKPKQLALAWWDRRTAAHNAILKFCKKLGKIKGYIYYRPGKWGPRAETMPIQWVRDKKSADGWLPNKRITGGHAFHKQMCEPQYELPTQNQLASELGLPAVYAAGAGIGLLQPGLSVGDRQVILVLPDELKEADKKPGFKRISDIAGERLVVKANKKKPKKRKTKT